MTSSLASASLTQDLIRLSAIPSISAPGYPEPPARRCWRRTSWSPSCCATPGVQNVGALELPGTAPGGHRRDPRARRARRPCCSTATTTSSPPGDESLWTLAAVRADRARRRALRPRHGRLQGERDRHVGALRAWDGRPPVGIKVVIEGQEEVGGGALLTYPPTTPDAFRADAMVIADMGSVRPGVPTLTVALRGMAMVTIEVTTLAGAKHSGQFGGAAPDALIVLLQALASLHDERGDVAVAGLRARGVDGRVLQRRRVPRARRGAAGPAADGHRRPRLARLVGAGDHRHRDRRAVGRRRAQRRLAARAREAQPARAPGAGRRRGAGRARPPPRGRAAVRDRARGRTRRRPATASRPRTDRPGVRGGARRDGGRVGASAVVSCAGGGSIPLVSALQAAAPDAEILLVGATDGYANIHAPDERVLLDELEKATVAEAEFFGEFAARWARVTDAAVRPRRSRPRACSACSTGSSASATGCRTRRSSSCGSASA